MQIVCKNANSCKYKDLLIYITLFAKMRIQENKIIIIDDLKLENQALGLFFINWHDNCINI